MGKYKITVIEKLNLGWKQTVSTTGTGLSMLLNEKGKDKQVASKDSETRPSRSNKTFRCTVYRNDRQIRAIPFTFFNSKIKIA
jgi:hypothetical protein